MSGHQKRSKEMALKPGLRQRTETRRWLRPGLYARRGPSIHLRVRGREGESQACASAGGETEAESFRASE